MGKSYGEVKKNYKEIKTKKKKEEGGKRNMEKSTGG